MKEILEKIDYEMGRIKELLQCQNGINENFKATIPVLEQIKKDLLHYEKMKTVTVTERNMSFFVGKQKLQKPPKLSLEKRIELLKQSKEKPTTGGYNEAELRSLVCDVFATRDNYITAPNQLLINKIDGVFWNTKSFLDLKNRYVLYCLYDNSRKFKDIQKEFRLPTRREKVIFEAFYPEYRTEPEKIDLSTLKVGDFVWCNEYDKVYEIYDISKIDDKKEWFKLINNADGTEYNLNSGYLGSQHFRPATGKEISDYVNRPIDVDSLEVGDLFLWKSGNELIKIYQLHAKKMKMERVISGFHDFQPYDLPNEVIQCFRYPTQKEINEYLAEQKKIEPKFEMGNIKDWLKEPENLEITNPEVGMLVIEKATNKIHKIKNISAAEPTYKYKLNKRAGLWSIEALKRDYRLPTESELKAYQERKQAKRDGKNCNDIMYRKNYD